MIEILEFIFQDFIHWFGTYLLLAAPLLGLRLFGVGKK